MTNSRAFSANELDERIAQRLAQLGELLSSASRSRSDVRIVAVTKTFDVEVVHAAVRCGLTHLAENYLDELVTKKSVCPGEVTWHFLGALQSRKIPDIVRYADVIESLSRRREIDLLAREVRRPSVYIQVDYTGEVQRNGARPNELDELVGAAREAGLNLRGLMTVAPREPAAAAAAFSSLARAADRHQLAERSMGMSDDLMAALHAGSTEIRVGRALFGPRSGALGAGDLT